MNEKLNIQNLIEMLAEKHGMDKTDAESFVKEFFQLIEESLESDKYVKIKGLGTFKLIDVDSRESVNINTGERFEIQGHTKVYWIQKMLCLTPSMSSKLLPLYASEIFTFHSLFTRCKLHIQ